MLVKKGGIHTKLFDKFSDAPLVLAPDTPDAVRQNGIRALRTILDERKILEQGHWKNWHRGDTKVNIPELLAITKGTCHG